MNQVDQAHLDLTRQRRSLRIALRIRRQGLSPATRRKTAAAIARWVARAGWLRRDKRIAFYLSTAEEISCAPMMARALRTHCRLFLPKIIDHRQHRMRFAPMGTAYRRNRYGILEPRGPQRYRARDLDVIFVPLVGFDSQGQRLGMGGGFYDRAVAKRGEIGRTLPYLIGVAHSSQRVQALPTLHTDVPLDAVVTELGIETFHSLRRTG